MIMDTEAVRHAVDEGNRKFAAAAIRKDYAGMAALYTSLPGIRGAVAKASDQAADLYTLLFAR